MGAVGVYEFIELKFADYMFGKVQFVFFDTSVSAVLTTLQYLTVMVLFAYVGYILQILLKKMTVQWRAAVRFWIQFFCKKYFIFDNLFIGQKFFFHLKKISIFLEFYFFAIYLLFDSVKPYVCVIFCSDLWCAIVCKVCHVVFW